MLVSEFLPEDVAETLSCVQDTPQARWLDALPGRALSTSTSGIGILGLLLFSECDRACPEGETPNAEGQGITTPLFLSFF